MLGGGEPGGQKIISQVKTTTSNELQSLSCRKEGEEKGGGKRRLIWEWRRREGNGRLSSDDGKGR